jgi:hypothetical protein
LFPMTAPSIALPLQQRPHWSSVVAVAASPPAHPSGAAPMILKVCKAAETARLLLLRVVPLMAGQQRRCWLARQLRGRQQGRQHQACAADRGSWKHSVTVVHCPREQGTSSVQPAVCAACCNRLMSRWPGGGAGKEFWAMCVEEGKPGRHG